MSNTKPQQAWNDPQKITPEYVQKDLQFAVNSAFRPHPSTYKRAVAVLIRFEIDDLNCGPLEKELADIFTNLYKYEVEHCLIEKNKNPQVEVTDVLNKLSRAGYMDAGCLVILVFSGHGERSEKKPGHYELALGDALDGSGYIRTKKLYWSVVRALLEHEDADVLHILDCCFAAEGYDGTAEVLAATSMTEIAASSSSSCFTNALIKELRRASSQAGTVANLHGQMMRNRKMHNLEYTPFYAERRAKPSIILRRLGDTAKAQLPTIAQDAPRILITAHVDGDVGMKDVAEFRKWLLTQVPGKVKGLEVKVEGLWKTNSSIYLLSLPVEIWTQLPDNPAYHYVGIVNSPNLLLTEPNPQSPAPLALRPGPGPENTKPVFGFGSGSGFK